MLQKIDGKTGSEASELAEFFAVVREHTLEGFLCDPIYGGNKDCVGWKLIGFPGAHWGYSQQQMSLGFDARSMPIRTLADIAASNKVQK